MFMELQKFILRELGPKTFTFTSGGLQWNKSQKIFAEKVVFYKALD